MSESTTTEGLEVLKGSRERILVRPWENRGFHYVSTAIQVLTAEGEYAFQKGKSFALKPSEARELADALVNMAGQVDTE